MQKVVVDSLPLLIFHLPDGFSAVHVEAQIEFFAGAFQFLPFPEAMIDLKVKEEWEGPFRWFFSITICRYYIYWVEVSGELHYHKQSNPVLLTVHQSQLTCHLQFLGRKQERLKST